MDKLSIVIVEDHHLFREGVKLIMCNTPHIEVIADFSNGKEFMDNLPLLDPDLVLMDIDMPHLNGLETTREALKTRPNLKIMVLSMLTDETSYYQMINAGVRGFMLKDSKSQELIYAIETIANGGNYFSQDLMRRIIARYTGPDARDERGISAGSFSDREMEVLRLLCKGKSTQEIADNLFISHRTVEGHRYNLLHKTNTKNTVSLVMFALKNKIVAV
jgi:DNA-binding NarL/FixJ family response regulator